MNINPNNIKTLAVFGCGGTGSHVAAGLARLEKAINELGGKFPKVTICDPDVVEQPNVGRQLFSQDDVGVNKATAMAQRINMAYGLQWEASTSDIKCDLTMVCVDSRKARHRIYKGRTCKDWFIDCGNDSSTGQVVLGGGDIPLPHQTYRKLIDRRHKEAGPSCSLAEALESQELFINQAIATYALQLVWSMFRYGKVNCRGYFINLNGSTQPIKLQ